MTEIISKFPLCIRRYLEEAPRCCIMINEFDFGGICFGASAQDEWFDALSMILTDADVVPRIGDVCRAVVEANFSVEVLSAKLADIIRAVAG